MQGCGAGQGSLTAVQRWSMSLCPCPWWVLVHGGSLSLVSLPTAGFCPPAQSMKSWCPVLLPSPLAKPPLGTDRQSGSGSVVDRHLGSGSAFVSGQGVRLWQWICAWTGSRAWQWIRVRQACDPSLSQPPRVARASQPGLPGQQPPAPVTVLVSPPGAVTSAVTGGHDNGDRPRL